MKTVCKQGMLTIAIGGAILMATWGCGSSGGLTLAPVYGTVTYKGKPLDHGQVIFNPEADGAGVLALGMIGGSGAYELQTGSLKGAPLGKYIVTVQCRQKVAPQNVNGRPVAPPSLIPVQYSKVTGSPLRFEVQKGSNQFNVALE